MNQAALQRENNYLWIALAAMLVWCYSQGALPFVPGLIDESIGVDTRGPHMLIVRETSNTLPDEQLAIFASADLRDYLDRSNFEYRILDQDAALEFVDQKWRDAMAIDRDSVPWLYVWNGVRRSIPLPDSVDDLIDVLEGYE